MSASLIKQAISDLKQAVAYRDGHVREFCPHVIGWKNGVRHVLTWQFAGYSDRGLPEGGEWRCFDVEALYGVILRPGPWHRGWTSGRGRQRCIDDVELAVIPEFAAVVLDRAPVLPQRSR